MIEFIVAEKYLSGNPILITASGLEANSVLDYDIYDDQSEKIYSGRAYVLTDSVSIDISSLFSKFNTLRAEWYTVVFKIDDNVVAQKIFWIYAGAVNSLLLRKLSSVNKDIFELKLNSSSNNFLLSTRSFGRYLFIPENELMPLYYYKMGKNFEISYGPGMSETIDHTSLPQEGIGVIDLNVKRKEYFDNNKALCNIIDVKNTDTGLVFLSIIITEARPARHFVKFRNSFLAFEKMAIDDIVDFHAEFTHSELKKYDDSVSRYVSKNQKTEMKSVYNATITARTNAELLWLIDMLLSREQYFIADGYEYPVLVRAEEPILQTTSGNPVSITVSIHPVDTESAFSATNTDTRSNPGIFSDEFNEIFY